MYAVADTYGVLGLKRLANQKFRDAVREYWDSSEFVKSIKVVYTSTPSEDQGLRQEVNRVLVNRRELLDKPEVKNVMKEVPGLAADVLEWIRETQEEPTKEEHTELERIDASGVECVPQ